MPSDGGSDNGIGGNEGSMGGGSGGSGGYGGFGGLGIGNPGSYGGQDTVGAPGFGGMDSSGADNDAQNSYGYDPGVAADNQKAENDVGNFGEAGINPEGIGELGLFGRMMQNPLFRGRDILSSDNPARDAAQFAALKGEISQEQADAYSASPRATAANLAFSTPGRIARGALGFANPALGVISNVGAATLDPNPSRAVPNAAAGAIIGGLSSGVGSQIGGWGGVLASKGVSTIGKGLSKGGPTGPSNGLSGTDGNGGQPSLDLAMGAGPVTPGPAAPVASATRAGGIAPFGSGGVFSGSGSGIFG